MVAASTATCALSSPRSNLQTGLGETFLDYDAVTTNDSGMVSFTGTFGRERS